MSALGRAQLKEPFSSRPSISHDRCEKGPNLSDPDQQFSRKQLKEAYRSVQGERRREDQHPLEDRWGRLM